MDGRLTTDFGVPGPDICATGERGVRERFTTFTFALEKLFRLRKQTIFRVVECLKFKLIRACLPVLPPARNPRLKVDFAGIVIIENNSLSNGESKHATGKNIST